jgi:hypothetical protein
MCIKKKSANIQKANFQARIYDFVLLKRNLNQS